MSVYANAADVLPPELLTEVRKHWLGYLYVSPGKKEKTLTGREEDILLSIQSGCSARKVAAAYHLSLWSVYRLARRLGALNPYAAKRRHRDGDSRSGAPTSPS